MNSLIASTASFHRGILVRRKTILLLRAIRPVSARERIPAAVLGISGRTSGRSGWRRHRTNGVQTESAVTSPVRNVTFVSPSRLAFLSSRRPASDQRDRSRSCVPTVLRVERRTAPGIQCRSPDPAHRHGRSDPRISDQPMVEKVHPLIEEPAPIPPDLLCDLVPIPALGVDDPPRVRCDIRCPHMSDDCGRPGNRVQRPGRYVKLLQRLQRLPQLHFRRQKVQSAAPVALGYL